jgi:hypothetical protein
MLVHLKATLSCQQLNALFGNATPWLTHGNNSCDAKQQEATWKTDPIAQCA